MQQAVTEVLDRGLPVYLIIILQSLLEPNGELSGTRQGLSVGFRFNELFALPAAATQSVSAHLAVRAAELLPVR